MTLEKIYAKSPVFLQNLAISAFGLAWHRRRFGGIFEQALQDFKAREHFTTEQFSDYQTIQLRRLLSHAYQTVPYYQDILNALGFNLGMLQKFELQDLPSLPFLEKSDLRTLGTSALLSRKRSKNGQFFSSSGSTGTPTQIFYSAAMHQQISAVTEARIRHWAGVSRLDPRGMIGGRRVVPDAVAQAPFYRYNRVEKQTYFSAYHLSAAHAPDYLDGLKKHRVAYMTGYASSNYFLARFLEEAGLEAPVLKAVLPGSEPLTPEMRTTFQRVYGCRTYNSWGSVEGCGIVSECKNGRLHISPDVAILEFLDPETGLPAQPGQLAEVICTGLLNFDQPLIRYRIGDLMRLDPNPCPCGREMPVIQEIIGRIEDTVLGPDGREMVRFHSIFTGIPVLIEAQVVQHTRTDFEVKVVATNPLNEGEKKRIQDRMEQQLGPIRLEISEQDSIPRGPNGKFKAVISHVTRS